MAVGLFAFWKRRGRAQPHAVTIVGVVPAIQVADAVVVGTTIPVATVSTTNLATPVASTVASSQSVYV